MPPVLPNLTWLASAAAHGAAHDTGPVTEQMFWTAVVIFTITYALIVAEKINRITCVLMGSLAMIFAGVIDQTTAIRSIDFNTLGLLIGMMVIINILRRTGFFQYFAVKTAKICRGEPVLVMMGFFAVTAVLSALLDNVTTVLLIAPVTILICATLDIDPLPMLLVEIIGSNVGGTATLIGDPPNILIGSATQLTFMDFVIHLAPLVVVLTVVVGAVFYYQYRNTFKADAEKIAQTLDIDEKQYLKDIPLLKKSLVVLGITLLGFLLHGALHLQPATVALGGATLLLLVTGLDPHHYLAEVEWTTIFFFSGLFVVVGGVEHVGLLDLLATKIQESTAGNMVVMCMALIVISAVASAIVDNIPLVAAMIPVISKLAQDMHPDITNTYQLATMPDVMPLWWSLALGACLGGNGSLVGASANVVVAGISERAGYPITFMRFLKVGAPITLLTLVFAAIYVYLRYLL